MPKCNPIQAVMVFYLYVKFEIDWSNGFQVRVRKPHPDRQTDRRTEGQTDVGHINLIGGLVTRNPPKNESVERVILYTLMVK